MAFLDNSGDIILDAVLTDTGRMRLAKGDGTFRIVKFALGDDEIDYGLYNKNHESGSAYYDLEILQTPLLEAFTNNTSMMQSKLMSISRTNLLYLPVMKLYEYGRTLRNQDDTRASASDPRFVITCNEETGHLTTAGTTLGNGINAADVNGIIDGFGNSVADESYIRIDQGLNTDEIDPSFTLSQDLVETQYIIQIDNRLGRIVQTSNEVLDNTGGKTGGGTADNAAPVSFIDDDNIATYYLSFNTNPEYITDLRTWNNIDATGIQGPRGTSLVFSVQAQLQLQQSNFLFSKLGQTSQDWSGLDASLSSGDMEINYVDTTIKVTGATTGFSIDIPVRFVKKIN